MSVYCPQLHCSMLVTGLEMTQVMTQVMTSDPREDLHHGPSEDRPSYQIFPDPSDFERCCKLKSWLPSIVVEPTEGEVESGELRWPPEDFLPGQEGEEEVGESESESGEPAQISKL